MADFTINDVLVWARTKPADERYRFSSTYNCALCQFLKETGRAAKPLVGGSDWRDQLGDKCDRDIPEDLRRRLICDTFGALVQRLEALCPETPITQSNWSAIDAYLTDIETVSA